MKKLVLVIMVITFCQLAFGQVKVADGKLGVGTATPAQKLHVVGNAYLDGNVGVGIANPTQKLHVDGNGLFTGNGLFNGSLGVGVTTPSQKLHVDGNGLFNGNGLFIGNVGIGTVTPSQKLHVEGNAYLSGRVDIGDVITSSYKLTVKGRVLFDFGGDLIFGSKAHVISSDIPMSDPFVASTAYPAINNSIYLGAVNNRFARLYTYTVNYHTLVQNSDMRLKENITPCPPLLSKLNKVQAYNYNFTDEYFKDFTEEEKEAMQRTEYGFLAQEVQKIFPELVYVTDSTGMLAINYVGMIPILTSAINELQKEVETLRNELSTYRSEVTRKSTAEDKSAETLQFNLSDTETEKMRVEQNAPNPFNERTAVRCHIPQTVSSVQLCIYDMQGAQIKCLPISERGTVDVPIEAGTLASGIYTYLLVASNGSTSEAKQMILTK
ncbi:MAG: tail fiber domain-containing protein [Cytophagaceae bacterium]|jgi:hypothetical protein|nr:tail fiber domain-containing protein [Cytophagaceae bacterium]